MKDSKKSGKKKQKSSEVPELDQLKSVVAGMKKMAKSLAKLQKENEALKSDLEKSKKKKKDKKKKKKKAEVITNVMEPQVLPPDEPKVKKSKKAAAETVSGNFTEKAVSMPTPEAAPEEKPAPKAKAKPGRKLKDITTAEANTTEAATADTEAPAPATAALKAKKTPKAKTNTKAKAAPVADRPAGPEELRFVQGLGAKIESLLNEKGIKTFADLAKARQASVKEVLAQSGPRFKNQDPKPLIEQAKLIKAEKWADLEAYQASLMEGKAKPGPKAGTSRKKAK